MLFGPNPCGECGGEYGEHSEGCRFKPRIEPGIEITNITRKRLLMEEVMELGRSEDELVKIDAVLFARNPGDESLARKIQTRFARADKAKEVAEKVINLIHQYWPPEKS